MAINDPRDIPDLLAWYSAEAETVYADGAACTTWHDLSGNGFDATSAHATIHPVWRSTGGLLGGPRVVWPSSLITSTGIGYDVPLALWTGVTEAFIAYSINTGLPSSNQNGFSRFSQSPSDINAFFPFSSPASIFDHFFSATRREVTLSASILDTWVRYTAMSKAGSWKAWVDNSNRVAAGSNSISAPTSQANSRIGTSGRQFRDGAMGYVLIYERELTTGEMADLDAWGAANPSGGLLYAPKANLLDRRRRLLPILAR